MLVELLEKEKIVLEIVREYLNNNRQFDLDEIVPFISSRLRETPINLNYKGINMILTSLLKKKYLVEGSKLSQEDVLENEKRREIFQYILNSPGAYFNEIVSQLGFSNHVVVWHLSILLKFNFIKKQLLDKHDIYFDVRTTAEDASRHYYLSKSKSNQIIKYLEKENIGVTKTELSSKLNIHINTVLKYLTILQKYEIIKSEKIDKKTLYFLNSKF